MKSETMLIDQSQDLKDRFFYKLGGAAALLVLLTALAEIGITFLPGGYITVETVPDWFTLLQNNPFLGLRNLGLMNIIMTTLEIPLLFTLFLAHRRVLQNHAALAMIVSLLGSAVFFSTNRAFPMLDLSRQYAITAPETQRAAIEAAGQAMLSVGQSHTPGTFLAFFLSGLGGIAISIVMLRGGIFSKAAAVAGIAGFGFLVVFDLVSSFVPSLYDSILILAMIGGILNITWYFLVSRRLFQLGKHGI